MSGVSIMSGTNATTGRALSGIDHLRQSITDILATPIGSRIMRKDYGSNLFKLIDSAVNPAGVIDIYAEAADALKKWETRFTLTRVYISDNNSLRAGNVLLNIEGEYLIDGQSITLEGIQI